MVEVFAGNLTWLKFLLCLVSSLLSVAAVGWSRGRPFETPLLRNAVIGMTLLKFAACVPVYMIAPLDLMGSDAVVHYFPQANSLLSGEIPYRDFVTSYGPLFPLLLIPGLLLWKSPGSIVLTMLTVEASMLVIYAVRCQRAGASHYWRVLFLYVFSPLSWYWVGAVGTNSVVVGLVAILGLVLAEKNRNLAAGIAMATGLLFSKITLVLSWPGILFFGRRGLRSRGAAMAVLLVAVLALTLVGVDIAERALEQRFRATSGNLWFLLSMLMDVESDARDLKWLSMITLVCVLAPLCLLFAGGRVLQGRAGFDSAAAFVAAVNLIFMMLAYKTYPWYYPAFLVLVLHSLLIDGDHGVRRLIPLVLLGSLATLEPRLWMVARGSDLGLWSWVGGTLFVADVAVLTAVLYWTILCIKRSAGGESYP